jgi:hypothetical protein
MGPHPEQQLTLIADFAAEILNENNLDDILWLIIERIIKALDLEDCIIYLLPIGSDHLIQRAAFGPILLPGLARSVFNNRCQYDSCTALRNPAARKSDRGSNVPAVRQCNDPGKAPHLFK